MTKKDIIIQLDYSGHYPTKTVLVTSKEYELIDAVAKTTHDDLTDYAIERMIDDDEKVNAVKKLIVELCTNEDRLVSDPFRSFVVYE